MPKPKRTKPTPGKTPKKVKNMMRKYRGARDDKRKLPKFAGRCSGLGMFKFMAQAFENNERVVREDKLTNEALRLMFSDEFPQNKGMIQGFKDGTRTVNYYRDLYNRGRMTNDEPPPVISYRYNDYGLAVDILTGNKLLSTDERMTYARKFFGLHSALRARKQGDEQLTSDEQPSSDS